MIALPSVDGLSKGRICSRVGRTGWNVVRGILTKLEAGRLVLIIVVASRGKHGHNGKEQEGNYDDNHPDVSGNGDNVSKQTCTWNYKKG